ncbi:hypothetical protein, partial [Kitasatospora putterlickiae]
MNAVELCVQVLRWSRRTDRPAPAGPIGDPEGLLDPAGEAGPLLAELVRDRAARLGAGRPPFGDAGAPSAAALLLAAA